LIKAVATEPFTGIENLWKTDKSKGHHNYPDFGKYIPINYFKVFALLHPMHGLILSIGT
jgi:hypothetical protein